MPATPPTADSLRAWLIVAAAFAAMFTAFGIAYSFGAFFDSMADEFGSSRGATAAVFSLTSLTYFGLGALSGLALDRYGPRRVLLVGAAALGAGLLATSQAGALWLGSVTYGFGVGIGVACAYVPMVALVGGWFERRRTLALGVAVSGIGLGTLLVAPLAAALIDELGWRDTYLVFGIAGTTVLVLCALVVSPAPQATAPGALRVREAMREPDYRRLYLSALLVSIGLFVPFVHLPAYAEERGVADVTAAALVGVIGAASIVGRLALGAVASRIGLIRTYQGCFLAMGSSFALWAAADGGLAVLVAFASLLGLGYGGFVALSPAVVAERFGSEHLGGLLGVLYTGAGLGSAFGAPAAGALVDSTDGYGLAIAGCLVLGLAAFATVLPLARRPAWSPTTPRL